MVAKLFFSFQNAHTMSDATYKIVYEGYPVLTIGTTDKSKQFHPFGLAITYEEQTEDFSQSKWELNYIFQLHMKQIFNK